MAFTTQQTDPIGIWYPNGANEAVQVYVWSTVSNQPVLWDGQASFSGTISVGSVSGSLTNNNAPPAANNIGVLPAVVSTTSLGYTAGNQALLRVDTTGALIISGTISVSTTGLALASNQTDGSQKTQVVNTTNNTQAFGAGTTTTTTIRVVLPTDQTSIPVTFTTGTTTISGNVTVVQSTGTNLHVVVDSGNINSTVSGTVTATISNATISVVSTTLATAAAQTDGTQKVQSVNTTGNTIAFGSGVSGTTTQRVVNASSSPFQKSTLSTTVTAVTTAASIMTGYYIYNANTTVAYVQVFDATTGAVTLGSTAPKQSYGIPASSAANVAGKRVSFTTAISIAATTTVAGSTAPSSGLDVNFDYE